MKLFGREYGMLYSVGAQQEIAELCPENDLTKLSEALGGKAFERTAMAARIPMILSNWHERAESLIAREEGREYTPAPITWDLIALLSVEEFSALLTEAFKVMARDSGRSVEADAGEKKTEAAGSSLS